MRKKLLLISLFLSGCGHVNKYVHDGIPPEQQQRDKYECERQSKQLFVNDRTQKNMYEKCMKSKGYKVLLDKDGDEVEEDIDDDE